jgi:hypothetical protein
VRWIFPGQLQSAVAGWFGRFPARTESREDSYLLDPQLRGLSVKVRGHGALEVKAYRGSPGILDVAGRACGRMEFWQKWSFPVSPPSGDSGDPLGWRPVNKKRRVSGFSLASGLILAPAAGLGQLPRCEVELTEVRAGGQDWWTLGFEATGPADLLRSELQAAATLVFAQALPGGVEPGPDESRSYAEWLGQRPGAESDTGAVDLARLTCTAPNALRSWTTPTRGGRQHVLVAMSKGGPAEYGGHKRSGCSPVAGSAVGSITLSSR